MKRSRRMSSAARSNRGSASGSAYVYVRSGTSWSVQQKLTASDGSSGDLFGIAVGIHGDTIVVGARQYDYLGYGPKTGIVYVFKYNSTTSEWFETAKLTADDAAANDQFGFSVSVSGNIVAVGA